MLHQQISGVAQLRPPAFPFALRALPDRFSIRAFGSTAPRPENPRWDFPDRPAVANLVWPIASLRPLTPIERNHGKGTRGKLFTRLKAFRFNR